MIYICKCIFWYCISDKADPQQVQHIHLTILEEKNKKVSIEFFQVKKCPRCKKDLKGIGKIEKQIQCMHRDFRQIMDDIQESNAETNIKKFSQLLSEIEWVRRSY